MTEYIERDVVLKHKTLIPGFIGEYVSVDRIVEAPAADVVSMEVHRQVMQERDLAIQQLREDYGVSLGEKKADVAPVVHGRWVGSAFDMACSACGSYQNLYTGRTKYCPNCGARMDSDT